MDKRKGPVAIHGIECPRCLQRIWSKHVHDFHYCFCGYCYIDGGRDYFRFGWGGKDFPTPFEQPKRVRISNGQVS